ncbi:MAG: alanine racemase [Rickettsiales bacterium]|jgi:alanine racemase|nr:alanine racemase [Rickettsiales bacterium]
MQTLINIKIDYGAVKHNFNVLQKITKCGAEVIPVLKADAYCFGAENVVKALRPQNKFFTYSIDEGIRLRKMFKDIEIYVFSCILPNDNERLKNYNLIPVINSFEQLKSCESKNIILQFNTGMNRNGIQLNIIKDIKEWTDSHNDIIMVMSHMACSGDKEHALNKLQIDNFRKVAEFFPNAKRSLMATDGILNFDIGNLCDSCRVGTYLYYGDRLAFDIRYSMKNGAMPLGLRDGLMSDCAKDGYVLVDGRRVKIKSIQYEQTYLDVESGEEVIIANDSFRDFLRCQNIEEIETIARLIAKPIAFDGEYKRIEVDENFFYSQVMETYKVSGDGFAGYGATREVKEGEYIAIVAGGYLDGICRGISNKGCVVHINNKPFEIWGRLSMDQMIVKADETVKVGDGVIISKSDIVKKTGKEAIELFYMQDKSYRVKKI